MLGIVLQNLLRLLNALGFADFNLASSSAVAVLRLSALLDQSLIQILPISLFVLLSHLNQLISLDRPTSDSLPGLIKLGQSFPSSASNALIYDPKPDMQLNRIWLHESAVGKLRAEQSTTRL